MNTANAEFVTALKYVFENCGYEVLADTRRINAFMLDLVPKRDSEREILKKVLTENTGNILIKAYGQTDDDKKAIFSECFEKLKENTELKENEIIFALNTLSESLDIGYQLSEIKEEISAKVLKKGDIPTNVRNIEEYLNDVAEISYKALSCNTECEKAIIPESVKQIKSKAFFGCTKLKQVIIPSSAEQIGERIFEGCDKLESITAYKNARYKSINGMLTDTLNHELIRAVNGNIYQNFSIPDGTEKIRAYAFENSYVKKIEIPSTLKEISLNAFVNCIYLEEYAVNPMNRIFSSYEGVVYSADTKELIRYPQGKRNTGYIIEDRTERIAEKAFYGAEYLENVTFTGSLKTIGAESFENCIKLRSVTLPNSVVSVGERAFENCTAIQNVMLPKGIEEIGDMSFSGCTMLKSISIPQTVSRIGHGAFMKCHNLSRIVIQDKVKFIGDGAFSECSPSLEICIRNNDYAEIYCKSHRLKYNKL